MIQQFYFNPRLNNLLFQTIQLNISHLFTQLNDQIVIFLTIQVNISYLFVHSLNVKPFYLTLW